jgi:hypothetical protein
MNGLLVLAAGAGRSVGLNRCLVIYTAMLTAFLAVVIALAWRYGRPRAWPAASVWGVVVGAVVISIVWWWINGVVEGRVLISVTGSHALTVGDLLALPVLVGGVLVVAARLLDPDPAVRGASR